MSSDSSYDSHLVPVQLKGEFLDFDLGYDVDHRKKRRNRTTQSCLNCHTSKRKCDRKRPCSRCIQLGLTGLCVYEVDDPALRDDPNVDENTRLRNRIAELESLVRELRGKPHPRWAEPNFCDGDASEKWHSRSNRRAQAHFQRLKRDALDEHGHGVDVSQYPPSVKVEQNAEIAQRHLYRLSPSPTSVSPGHPYQSHHGPIDCSIADDAPMSSYPSSIATTPQAYGQQQQRHHPSLTMSNGDGYYHQSYHRSTDVHDVESCPCLLNPAAGHPLIRLRDQIQSSLEQLQHLPEHSGRHHCTMLKRIIQLHDVMHGGTIDVDANPVNYRGLPTPTESEVMSPISNSSHSSINNAMGSEWSSPISASNSTHPAGHYDTYFPVEAGEHGMYHKTYHVS